VEIAEAGRLEIKGRNTSTSVVPTILSLVLW